MQNGRWAANVGSRLKLTDAPEGIVCYAILPAVLGTTHRRNEGGRGNVGIIRTIRATILPDLSGHERAFFAVMHNAASTPFSVLV